MRLNGETATALPAAVTRFGYDRGKSTVGIVHFGLGAFHRAHMAWYTDLCMDEGDQRWSISGVSLRSGSVAAQLQPQTGLYTLTMRSGDTGQTRLIGSVREALVAGPDAAQITARIAHADCHTVSFTVTEKGYARNAQGGLDRAAARHSFYPMLAAGLAARMDAGLPGITLLSCDNLPANGAVLRRLLLEWAQPALAEWIERTCRFPASMVDRIVPATTPADLAALETRIGLRDEAAVFAEAFSQWVIEDDFAGPRPAWEAHDVQFVADVAAYETAKLRMLNGAHSALAYCGLARGHRHVHEAMADPALAALISQIMRREAATSFTPAPGQDLAAYADLLERRFADPALNHSLVQIAMDGSQKVPQRWLAAMADQARLGQACSGLITALGAWLAHTRGDNGKVDDPLADAFAALWAQHDAASVAAALFGPGGRFAGTWQASEAELAAIAAAVLAI